MLGSANSSFQIFRLFGISVSLHWTWFIVAFIMIMQFDIFTNRVWAVLTYLTLFAIVTMHEYGHALACRSVGGRAERIILWPLGGIAYVQPPPRPGALLWSIVAGPLVNFVLIPVTAVLAVLMVPPDYIFNIGHSGATDLQRFVTVIMYMNFGLFAFNMLPIFPLDGGQILQSLLWFVVGRAKSLHIAASIGLVVAGLAGVLALLTFDVWMLVLALFLGFQAYNGIRMARYLAATGGYAPGELHPYRGA